jgi:hypothetical protein
MGAFKDTCGAIGTQVVHPRREFVLQYGCFLTTADELGEETSSKQDLDDSHDEFLGRENREQQG